VLKLARRISQQNYSGGKPPLPSISFTGARSSKGGKGETDEAEEAESEATTEIVTNPPLAAETPNLESGGDGGKIDSSRDPVL